MYAPGGKIAAKQGDKIINTDIHILLVASPTGLVPTPTPHFFNGILTTNLSKDVFIEGKPAATVDSVAVNMPPHFPTSPGVFQRPPSNQGKILVGSTGVFINGKPAARMGDTAITCNDPVDLATGAVVAVGKVFIGETGAGAPVKPPQPPLEPKLIRARIGQPGKITNAAWEKNRTKAGDKVKMIVDVQGFEDGTPAKFVVWRKNVNGENIFIKDMEGKVRANRVEAVLEYAQEEVKQDLEASVEQVKGEPEYYFSVDVEGEEARSKVLTFTFPLDIYLEDPDGKPLDGVDYVITLSDGTKKKGKFRNGHVKIDDAPYGNFTLEVEGYDFVYG